MLMSTTSYMDTYEGTKAQRRAPKERYQKLIYKLIYWSTRIQEESVRVHVYCVTSGNLSKQKLNRIPPRGFILTVTAAVCPAAELRERERERRFARPPFPPCRCKRMIAVGVDDGESPPRKVDRTA